MREGSQPARLAPEKRKKKKVGSLLSPTRQMKMADKRKKRPYQRTELAKKAKFLERSSAEKLHSKERERE